MVGSYCKFCGRRCFMHLPKDTPEKIKNAFRIGKNQGYYLIATCREGQEFDKEETGYCWSDIPKEARDNGGFA